MEADAFPKLTATQQDERQPARSTEAMYKQQQLWVTEVLAKLAKIVI